MASENLKTSTVEMVEIAADVADRRTLVKDELREDAAVASVAATAVQLHREALDNSQGALFSIGNGYWVINAAKAHQLEENVVSGIISREQAIDKAVAAGYVGEIVKL